ncbi:MAG: hypothetical protein QXX17_06270 [Conexivisphaerales archaeon]
MPRGLSSLRPRAETPFTIREEPDREGQRYLKDRVESFDGYYPCRKKGCYLAHA